MVTDSEFEDLYRQCAPMVHARARRMLGAPPEADDVVQDVFTKLWKKPPEHGRMLPWLMEASTNACLDRLRAAKRRDPHWEVAVRLEAADRDKRIDELLANKELCRRLIVRADEETQQIVALVYFDDASQEDAAALLGIARKTVNERLSRFHDLARKVIQRWKT